MKKELIDVIKQLRHEQNVQDQWLNELPNELHSAFFDNDYVNSMGLQHDMLITSLFKDSAEDVFWFLYDFKIGKTKGPHIITADGVPYTFLKDEDFYDYLESL